MEEPREPESTQLPPATVRATASAVSNAVWTVPNIISMARIVLIGVFGWLLVAGHDLWAITALAAAGISDFLDGFLARRWRQVTHLGRLLDPAADRLMTAVVVIALAVRGVVPWWLVALLLARDALVAVALVLGRTHEVSSPQVTFTGKAATAALYVFLPLAFLAYERWDTVHAVAIIGTCAAAGLYWISGIGYVRDVAERLRSAALGASAAGGR